MSGALVQYHNGSSSGGDGEALLCVRARTKCPSFHPSIVRRPPRLAVRTET